MNLLHRLCKTIGGASVQKHFEAGLGGYGSEADPKATEHLLLEGKLKKKKFKKKFKKN